MWVVFSLINAIVSSVLSILVKRLVHRYHFALVASAMFAFAIPFLLVVLLISPPKEVETLFWIGLLGTSLLNILANYMLFRAVELEDVSFLAPIAAFLPIMTMIVSVLTLGEFPSVIGIFGVVLVGIGALLLSKNTSPGAKVSLVSLFRRPSVQLNLGGFFLWAITPSLEKMAMLHVTPQNPAYLAFGMAAIVASGLGLISQRLGNHVFSAFKARWKEFCLLGFLVSASMLSAFAAFTQANVAYVSAVVRTNIFFSIILARFFLKERGIRSRLWASGFMFVGIVLLSL